MKRFPLRASLVFAVAAGALLAGGVAYATVPGSGGLIHGCYAKTSNGQAQAGALRVIATGMGSVVLRRSTGTSRA
jgi:hypothetical protein